VVVDNCGGKALHWRSAGSVSTSDGASRGDPGADMLKVAPKLRPNGFFDEGPSAQEAIFRAILRADLRPNLNKGEMSESKSL